MRIAYAQPTLLQSIPELRSFLAAARERLPIVVERAIEVGADQLPTVERVQWAAQPMHGVAQLVDAATGAAERAGIPSGNAPLWDAIRACMYYVGLGLAQLESAEHAAESGNATFATRELAELRREAAPQLDAWLGAALGMLG